jgi:hypothetical protein
MSAPSSPQREYNENLNAEQQAAQVSRLQRIRENQDPLFLTAIEKVSDACARFSRERDGMLLTVSE